MNYSGSLPSLSTTLTSRKITSATWPKTLYLHTWGGTLDTRPPSLTQGSTTCYPMARSINEYTLTTLSRSYTLLSLIRLTWSKRTLCFKCLTSTKMVTCMPVTWFRPSNMSTRCLTLVKNSRAWRHTTRIVSWLVAGHWNGMTRLTFRNSTIFSTKMLMQCFKRRVKKLVIKTALRNSTPALLRSSSSKWCRHLKSSRTRQFS